MNWTGGKLQRQTGKGGRAATLAQQKSYFAKARAKQQERPASPPSFTQYGAYEGEKSRRKRYSSLQGRQQKLEEFSTVAPLAKRLSSMTPQESRSDQLSKRSDARQLHGKSGTSEQHLSRSTVAERTLSAEDDPVDHKRRKLLDRSDWAGLEPTVSPHFDKQFKKPWVPLKARNTLDKYNGDDDWPDVYRRFRVPSVGNAYMMSGALNPPEQSSIRVAIGQEALASDTRSTQPSQMTGVNGSAVEFLPPKSGDLVAETVKTNNSIDAKKENGHFLAHDPTSSSSGLLGADPSSRPWETTEKIDKFCQLQSPPFQKPEVRSSISGDSPFIGAAKLLRSQTTDIQTNVAELGSTIAGEQGIAVENGRKDVANDATVSAEDNRDWKNFIQIPEDPTSQVQAPSIINARPSKHLDNVPNMTAKHTFQSAHDGLYEPPMKSKEQQLSVGRSFDESLPSKARVEVYENESWKAFIFGSSGPQKNGTQSPRSHDSKFRAPELLRSSSSILSGSLNSSTQANATSPDNLSQVPNDDEDIYRPKSPEKSQHLGPSTDSSFSLDRPSSVANASIVPTVLYNPNARAELSSPDPLTADQIRRSDCVAGVGGAEVVSTKTAHHWNKFKMFMERK